MKLKNLRNINDMLNTVERCKVDVRLRSADDKEEFNLKSVLSRYIAIGRLCEEQGDAYEIFCMNKSDEPLFFELHRKLDEPPAV